MKPTITEVTGFGPHGWEIELTYPNGQRYYRVKTKAECPDELAAYTAVLKEIEES